MKIFIRSVKLWLLGICVEAHKRHFDRTVDKYIEKNRPLSSRRLTALSHRCSCLYQKFNYEEQRLLYDIQLNRLTR